MMRRWRELSLSLASILIALVLAELATRWYLRHRERASLARVRQQVSIDHVDSCQLGDIIQLADKPGPFYTLKAGLRARYCGGTLTTNALGMRMQREPELAKADGVLRIVGLGDSYLFGQGVSDGQGFLEVFEARARAAGEAVEALNFAVPGYNTWMEWQVLSTRARHFAPDVILVSITGNDWDLPDFMLSRPYGRVARSFLLGLLSERFRRPPKLMPTPRSRVYEDHFLATPEEVPAHLSHMVGFGAYRQGLKNILETASSIGARLVLFSDCLGEETPGSPTCQFPFGPGEYERVRAEVYAEPRVTICPWELSPTLLIEGDGHPTSRGHQSLADQLGACLKRSELLAVARPSQRTLSIADKRLHLEGFHDIEESPAGLLAWSREESAITVSGLTPGSSYDVTLTFRDHAQLGSLEVGWDRNHMQRVDLTSSGRAVVPTSGRAGRQGTLTLHLKTTTWKPSDVEGTDDVRALGLALQTVTLALNDPTWHRPSQP
jgi:lysophospholipase L1-like esterase